MKELDLDKAFNEEKPLKLRNGEKHLLFISILKTL
nr:MAG TPA: hypothetical protein [Caudoviricetes sp.]